MRALPDGVRLNVSGQVPVFRTVKDAVKPLVFGGWITAVPLGVTETPHMTNPSSSNVPLGLVGQMYDGPSPGLKVHAESETARTTATVQGTKRRPTTEGSARRGRSSQRHTACRSRASVPQSPAALWLHSSRGRIVQPPESVLNRLHNSIGLIGQIVHPRRGRFRVGRLQFCVTGSGTAHASTNARDHSHLQGAARRVVRASVSRVLLHPTARDRRGPAAGWRKASIVSWRVGGCVRTYAHASASASSACPRSTSVATRSRRSRINSWDSVLPWCTQPMVRRALLLTRSARWKWRTIPRTCVIYGRSWRLGTCGPVVTSTSVWSICRNGFASRYGTTGGWITKRSSAWWDGHCGQVAVTWGERRSGLVRTETPCRPWLRACGDGVRWRTTWREEDEGLASADSHHPRRLLVAFLGSLTPNVVVRRCSV